MMQPRSKWRGALWIFSIIAVLYAYSVYNAFFATELGYVYDSTTDRLFELNLTLNISTCDKWIRSLLSNIGSSPHRVGDFGLISYRVEHAGEDFEAQVLLVA
jgi:hypothetical protein